jgi:hypothetical protein
LQTLPEQLKPTAAPLGFYRTGGNPGPMPVLCLPRAGTMRHFADEKLAGPMMHNAQTPGRAR